MEIPEIGIFEAGMKCLQSPSYFSRFPPGSSIQMYSFWKWGALILAFLATFTRLLKQIKFLILHVRRIKPSPESILQHLNVDLDFSDDDDSLEASNGSSDDEGDEPKTPSTGDYLNFYTDFGVKGSSQYSNGEGQNGNLRFRRSRGENSSDGFKWADFSTGKNVVKIWDRLGMSFGLDSFDDSSDSDSESVVSLWDFNKDMKIREICRRSPQVSSMAVTSLSPAVVLSAKRDEKDERVVLEAYDTRVKSQTPVSYAEWSPLEWPSVEEVTLTSGGIEKVYVGDMAVGDMRKLETPLKM